MQENSRVKPVELGIWVTRGRRIAQLRMTRVEPECASEAASCVENGAFGRLHLYLCGLTGATPMPLVCVRPRGHHGSHMANSWRLPWYRKARRWMVNTWD